MCSHCISVKRFRKTFKVQKSSKNKALKRLERITKHFVHTDNCQQYLWNDIKKISKIGQAEKTWIFFS